MGRAGKNSLVGMTLRPPVLPEEASLPEIMAAFQEPHIILVPVIDIDKEGKVKGIITRRDVLKLFDTENSSRYSPCCH